MQVLLRNHSTYNRLTEPYQKGRTNLDFTEARDSEWQWHQLGHVQVCTSLQTDNHASTPPLSFLQAGCSTWRPTNSVKALKVWTHSNKCKSQLLRNNIGTFSRLYWYTCGSTSVNHLSGFWRNIVFLYIYLQFNHWRKADGKLYQKKIINNFTVLHQSNYMRLQYGKSLCWNYYNVQFI